MADIGNVAITILITNDTPQVGLNDEESIMRLGLELDDH
jgi:hypothetical protein